MILKGNQRGGSKDLALHLLKDENDHVDVHEIRGFVSDNLMGAMLEAYAVSKGTRAKQFLFSLSLNPPPQAKVSTDSFEAAIEKVEDKLGLNGQPRAIVFHEKEGRRHCHAVWSRTHIASMTAIPLPYTKRELMEVSKELYIQHGWQMPPGMINSEARDPYNFTLAQWQQAKRIGKDPRAIKEAFQDSWALSDNRESFANALKARGYHLAKGDRRGFVALDRACEVYAVPKWVGLKTKAVKAKLGSEKDLPSVQDTKAHIAKVMTDRLNKLNTEHSKAIEARKTALEAKRQALTNEHKLARQALEKAQEQRKDQERAIRQSRYRKGLRGLMDRVTGRHKRIRKANEYEILRHHQRDRQEKDDLIFKQLEAIRKLDQRHRRLQSFTQGKRQELSKDMKQFNAIANDKEAHFKFRESRESKRERQYQHHHRRGGAKQEM